MRLRDAVVYLLASLTLSWRSSLSYRNQSIDFLYDKDLRHESLHHSHHRCIKPGFTIANYSADKPINFYSNRNDFEHNAWFAFYHVFRVSLTYKTGQNDFDGNFYPNSPEKISCFRCKLMCNKEFYYLSELRSSHLTYFEKNFSVKYL